jgi:anti-sigma regulatory factor (Ser/Thr protein kinase)
MRALVSQDGGAPASSDGLSLRLCLGRDPQAPSLARSALRSFSEKADIAARERATLALLVSELVSNAVLHSDASPASGIMVRAGLLEQGAVRVEVVDAGSGFTATPRDPIRSTGGYGLFLVDEQASRWGIDRDGGTRVWFELETPAAASV